MILKKIQLVFFMGLMLVRSSFLKKGTTTNLLQWQFNEIKIMKDFMLINQIYISFM